MAPLYFAVKSLQLYYVTLLVSFVNYLVPLRLVVTSTLERRRNEYTKVLLKMFLKIKLDLSTVTVSTMIHNELQSGAIVIKCIPRSSPYKQNLLPLSPHQTYQMKIT